MEELFFKYHFLMFFLKIIYIFYMHMHIIFFIVYVVNITVHLFMSRETGSLTFLN